MQKTPKRVLALVLALVMTLSVFSISASAESADYNPNYQSETHTVFKHTAETLAPGVEYYNNYAYSSDGKQMVYYVTTADISRDDVICQISYKDMQCENYGMSKLTEQVAAANAKYSDPENPTLTEYERENYANENYVVVSATNGNGYNMTTGKPSGAWAMGGTVAQDMTSLGFLAILKNGKAVVGRTMDEWNSYKEQGIAEAINAFGSILVWDGEDVTKKTDTGRASRTMIGVTEDGKVVTAVLDGRQEPFSCGGSYHELAQIMLEAGCKYAFNLDGGGSTTFVKRSPGEEEAKIVNRPSDGSERSISNGIIIASTAKVKDEVASVVYTPETEYITPGTSIDVGCVAYDEDGSAIVRPSDLSFEVTGGTYENGVFTAPAETGDVTITAKSKGASVGEQVIHVVVPDSISFKDSGTIYKELGTSTPIDIIAAYSGGDVKLSASDFEFSVINTTPNYEGEEVGSFDGYIFNAPAKNSKNEARYETATITAKVKGGTAQATSTISFETPYHIAQDFEQTGMSSISFPYEEQYHQHEQATSEYVTRETGKVKHGDYAMAVNLDFTQVNGTGYLSIIQRFSTTSIKNAKKVGVWIYIPENLPGLWVQLRGLSNADINLIPTGELYKEKYDSGAWHYFEGDLNNTTSYTFSQLQFYFSDRDSTNNGYYFKDATNINNRCTFYVDALGYDKSEGSRDFYEPAFGDISAFVGSGSVGTKLVRGTAVDVNASTVSIVANVEDDTEKNPYVVSGLDYTSAKAYIDGVEVNANAANNTITIEDATLSAGVHTAKFVISDKEGNEAVIERQLNITAGANSALKLVSRTPVGTKLLIGSVHWFDLVAEDISKIDSAEVTLDLDGFNDWQKARIACADGFAATSSVDKITNTITLKINRTEGTPESNVLASIPVKVWESTLTTFEGYETYTPQNLFSRKIFWPIAVEIKPVVGAITLTDGSKDSFSFEKYLIDTEIDGNYAKLNEEGYFADGKTCWHLHTLEWREEPAEATCLTHGTDGTAFCTVCNEIVYIDEPVVGVHHYQWDIEKQKYVCKDCNRETEEKPTIEAAGTVGTFSDGVVEDGWVITEGEEDNIFYLKDGAKVKTNIEIPLFDGSGSKAISFNTSSPYSYTGLFTGAIAIGNYKIKVYEDGVLSTGDGDHLVSDGNKIWIVNKDGENAYTGKTVGFYEYEGVTYCVYYAKSGANQSTLNGGRWTGPLDYNKNTTATTNSYYIRGIKMDGWTCKSGAAYDAHDNLVTGWRNADGTPAEVDINDPETMVGKYCFGTDGKVKIGSNVVALTSTESENRYCTFGSKSSYLDNVGEFLRFYSGSSYVSDLYYVDGYPSVGYEFSSSTTYTYLYVNGKKITGQKNVITPVLYSDGYYYNLTGTQGYIISQYRLGKTSFGTSASFNVGMDPMYIEARYTGVVDDTENDKHGYAILGKLYEGYTLTDGKVCDENGDPINRSFINGFGDQIYYIDGVYMGENQTFTYEGKFYTVVDPYGKALPYNGIYKGKYYIDGILSDNEIYEEDYIISDGKVCYLNEDESIGDPVTGVIGDTYFEDGVAKDYQIVDGRILNDGEKLYNIVDGQKAGLYTGIYDDKYYVESEATDYQVVDGKYVFKDGILHNVNSDGSLGGRFTGTADGTAYTLGKPQNGWVADTYYYKNGKKVTGAIEIDGKAYKFNDEGELEGPYNGMLYDEANDVYRMYDQGKRKNGSDEFGKCVDGVPADGWYANEYYFVNGKYLTGIQQADGYYYDFGEDGSSSPFTKYTGLYFDEDAGVWRYLQLGELTSGWKDIDGDWYYFRASTMAAATGHYHFDGDVYYDFEDNGKLIDGVWAEFDQGWCYFYGPSYYRASGVSNVKFVEIDGVLYGFDNHGYRYEGLHSVFESNQRTAMLYDFDLVDGATLYTGLFEDRYYAEGIMQNAYALINVDGDFYFINDGNKIVKSATIYLGENYVAGKTFGDGTPVAAGMYEFDEDGKMLVNNGPVGDYFYVNGIKQKRYQLVSYGNDFYFINDGDKLVKNATLYLADKYVSGKTFADGTPVAAGSYEFGEDGKMIVNNGPVGDYFYVNGIKQKRYQLVNYGDDFYFINDGDKLVKSATLYLADKFVSGKTFADGTPLAAGYYEFDADGKMVIKNGPIGDYFYRNGTVVPRYQLVEYNGDYYFINDGNKIVKSAKLYLVQKYLDGTELTPGYYNFGEDGKMILD